jgi:signal transduction histidine kinase
MQDANARLIQAVQLATRKLASTGNFDQVLREVLAICVEAVGADGGTIYVHDPVKKRLRFQHVLPEDVAEKMPFTDIADDAGVAGKVFQSRQTQIDRFDATEERTRKEVESATGVFVRTMITVPLMMEHEEPIGLVQLINKRDGDFTAVDASVMDTVSAVSTMAYLNSRLMEEASRASTLLGMGKVSHDIGNLAASLFANIAFSELALEGMKEHLETAGDNETELMYVESLEGMFTDLKMSVDRIVGYSRLISDLSAGRELRPNMKLASMASTIQTSAAYLEPEGRKNHVALAYDIASNAPPTSHDELYIFRIVQNLVGNAIKAVKEIIPDDWEMKVEEEDEAIFGEVGIRYSFEDGAHVIEVRDSGPGMTPDVAERILSGTARSQWDKGGGSGWGLKIVLELAATHRGHVTIDSQPGCGATFRVTIPHAEEAGSPSEIRESHKS